MKNYRLCEHVLLKVNKEKKIVRLMSGPIYPHFAWNTKKQADTPRIKCSDCGRYIQVLGYIIERDPNSGYIPRAEATSDNKSRNKSRKGHSGNSSGETWRFVD